MDTFTLFRELGVPLKAIRLGGGGARGSLWRQIQADVYGHSVELLEAEEGGAFGAALLAGTGIGVWESVEAACAATVRVAETIGPKDVAVMDEGYKRYRRIYPALKAIQGS
jgi:xylulokinase